MSLNEMSITNETPYFKKVLDKYIAEEECIQKQEERNICH